MSEKTTAGAPRKVSLPENVRAPKKSEIREQNSQDAPVRLKRLQRRSRSSGNVDDALHHRNRSVRKKRIIGLESTVSRDSMELFVREANAVAGHYGLGIQDDHSGFGTEKYEEHRTPRSSDQNGAAREFDQGEERSGDQEKSESDQPYEGTPTRSRPPPSRLTGR